VLHSENSPRGGAGGDYGVVGPFAFGIQKGDGSAAAKRRRNLGIETVDLHRIALLFVLSSVPWGTDRHPAFATTKPCL
jgi:hypothetical protein